MPQKLKFSFEIKIILIGVLMLLRGLMIWFHFPYLLYNKSLFNSNSFALSSITPSFGDYLLNTTTILIACIILIKPSINYLESKINNKLIVQFAAILISALSLIYYYGLIVGIFTGSQSFIDLRLNLSDRGFSFKITAIFIFILGSFNYFICSHFTKYIFEKYPINFKNWPIITSFIIVASILIAIFLKIPILILLVHLAFLTIIIYYKLTISIKNFEYKATIYFALTAAVCSLIATQANLHFEKKNEFVAKQEFAKAILEENDSMGEFLIQIGNQSISNSEKIRKMLNQNPMQFDTIDKEIGNNHFKNWFDNYNINIQYFNALGLNLKNNLAPNFTQTWGNYKNIGQKTLIENLILLKNENNLKKYANLIELKNENNLNKYIIILFDEIGKGKSIYKSKPSLSLNNFNFSLINSKKSFQNTIQNAIPNEILNDTLLFSKVITFNNINFVGYKSLNNNQVIVFSPNISLNEYYRNFSFLFLILICVSILLLVFGSILNINNRASHSFATKIQIYLGIALIFPLLFTIYLTINTIDKSNTKKENEKNKAILKNISTNLCKKSNETAIDFAHKYYWESEILKQYDAFNLDINLYDKKGRIITTSNANALKKGVIQNNLTDFSLEKFNENLDKMSPILKSYLGQEYQLNLELLTDQKGKTTGYLTIPTVIISSLKNQETNELIGSILTIFTTLFILILVATVLISRHLTKPLSLITSYLQNTNLSKTNEPIVWQSNDELGQLVQEYNKMLLKIEDGKKLITRNEKQNAWQDIAKQVAHEIKNPLTPMKLTLQHLQNSLKLKNEIKIDKLEKSILNLLFNIDSVTDIVDSFSTFARMPLPKSEKFDLLKTLSLTHELHNLDQNILLTIPENIKKAIVWGDEKIISQIITNLIINALQSKKEHEAVIIKIGIEKNKYNYLISIADNGVGINEHLKQRVFLPNFSTKSDGYGIGLSLAKWGIENMNGNIWFESEVNIGSTFYIELPITT
jgi:two-component system, NtrC family, nitrogen regulation sensor histidine kinase NtrY